MHKQLIFLATSLSELFNEFIVLNKEFSTFADLLIDLSAKINRCSRKLCYTFNCDDCIKKHMSLRK